MKIITSTLFLLIIISGCNSLSSAVEPQTSYVKSFAFHKPRLGATFTMQDIGPGVDTIYLFTVNDTNANNEGKSGLVEFDRQPPFYISYRTNGDIDISGYADNVENRLSWKWYPLTLMPSKGIETYSLDTLTSNPNLNDTHLIERDTFTVVGKETLIIKGQAIDCIKATLGLNTISSSNKYGIVKSALNIDYWYAPLLGYWTKVHVMFKGIETSFTLIDFTL